MLTTRKPQSSQGYKTWEKVMNSTETQCHYITDNHSSDDDTVL